MYVIKYINRIMTYIINRLKYKLWLLLLYNYIFSIREGTTILKYTYINNIFEKNTIQTVLCLFIIFRFWLSIHVPNGIVKIFKFGIHSLLIFRWRTNNIQGFFDQSKWSFVIIIIYPISINTYGMIDITSCDNQLN